MKIVILAAVFGFASAGVLPGYQQQQQQYTGYSQQQNAAYTQEESHRPQAAFERSARILSADADLKEDSFRYNYETENGIKAEEVGHEANGIEAQGGFQYTGDDGKLYAVSYSAGQDGFQVHGEHIPTPPPVPEAILEALQKNAQDEAAGINDDGQYNPAKYGDENSAPQSQAYSAAQQYKQPYKY